MAWIRLSDDYIDNPKFLALSDGAFRLWHEAMAHCRKFKTDGVITFTTLKSLRSFSRRHEKALTQPHTDGANPLWLLIPATGYRVHDYLDWNLSKEEEQTDRDSAKARMRRLRSGAVTAPFAPSSVERSREHIGERSPNVPGRGGKEEAFKKETSDPFLNHTTTDRAGRFLDRYQELYPKHRNGARYALKPTRDYAAAVTLCATWPDERLDKLAVIFLTTNHDWAEQGSRTVPQFLGLASWCDGKLAAHEASKGAA